MSSQGAPITRGDIESRFRELNGEVVSGVDAARSKVLTVGVAIGVVVIAFAYLAGRRRGHSRSTVVEVRRV
jgi:hypothetical protein